MEKIGDISEEIPKQTAKERLLEVQGKDVPLDLFLFSCLEHERLLKATVPQGAVTLSWPVLLDQEAEDHKQYLGETPFESALQRLVSWYREEFPVLSARTPLNHEALSSVVPPIVALAKDIERLHVLKFGESLPVLEKAEASSGIWGQILSLVSSAFSHHCTYFSNFIKWCHAPEIKEEFIPGSRPPVGKYAPPPIRKDGAPSRRSPSGGSERGGVKPKRGPKPDRGERPAPMGRREPQDRHEKKSEPREKQSRFDRSNRKDRGGVPRPSETETQRLTEIALSEVDEALSKLRHDSTLSEIMLKPTNSFYRRIQHQKIVDAGFISSSIGEGHDRAVKVSRKE